MELGLWVPGGANVVVIEDEVAHRAIPRAHLQRGLCDCRGLREGKGVVCRLGVVGTAVPPAAFDLGLIHGIAPDVADVWTRWRQVRPGVPRISQVEGAPH